jgi:hypothetical protein
MGSARSCGSSRPRSSPCAESDGTYARSSAHRSSRARSPTSARLDARDVPAGCRRTLGSLACVSTPRRAQASWVEARGARSRATARSSWRAGHDLAQGRPTNPPLETPPLRPRNARRRRAGRTASTAPGRWARDIEPGTRPCRSAACASARGPRSGNLAQVRGLFADLAPRPAHAEPSNQASDLLKRGGR